MFIPHNPEKILDSITDFGIIVEGKRDKIALQLLGIDDVYDISGKPVEDLLDLVPRDRKYLILTDFDDEGERLRKTIHKLFSRNGLRFNSRLEHAVRDTFDITQIEELKRISKLKEDVYYGKISTINNKILNRSRFYRKRSGRKTRRDRSNIRSD